MVHSSTVLRTLFLAALASAAACGCGADPDVPDATTVAAATTSWSALGTGLAAATGPDAGIRIADVTLGSSLHTLVVDHGVVFTVARGRGEDASDAIVAIPADGGPARVIVAGVQARGLAVDADRVYYTHEVPWTRSGSEWGIELWSVPRAGGVAERVDSVSNVHGLAPLAVAGDQIVWGTCPGGLRKVHTSARLAQSWGSTAGGWGRGNCPGHLAIADGWVYWPDHRQVLGASLSDDSRVTLVDGRVDDAFVWPEGVTAHDGSLYWWADDRWKLYETSLASRVTRAVLHSAVDPYGGDSPPFDASGRLLFHESRGRNAPSHISALTFTPGAPAVSAWDREDIETPVATSDGSVEKITVSGGFVYWATRSGIYRRALPPS